MSNLNGYSLFITVAETFIVLGLGFLIISLCLEVFPDILPMLQLINPLVVRKPNGSVKRGFY